MDLANGIFSEAVTVWPTAGGRRGRSAVENSIASRADQRHQRWEPNRSANGASSGPGACRRKTTRLTRRRPINYPLDSDATRRSRSTGTPDMGVNLWGASPLYENGKSQGGQYTKCNSHRQKY